MAKQLARKVLSSDKSLKPEDLTVDFGFFTAGELISNNGEYQGGHASNRLSCMELTTFFIHRLWGCWIYSVGCNVPHSLRRGIDGCERPPETCRSNERLHQGELWSHCWRQTHSPSEPSGDSIRVSTSRDRERRG
jgi:hypothetical protein